MRSVARCWWRSDCGWPPRAGESVAGLDRPAALPVGVVGLVGAGDGGRLRGLVVAGCGRLVGQAVRSRCRGAPGLAAVVGVGPLLGHAAQLPGRCAVDTEEFGHCDEKPGDHSVWVRLTTLPSGSLMWATR